MKASIVFSHKRLIFAYSAFSRCVHISRDINTVISGEQSNTIPNNPYDMHKSLELHKKLPRK